MKKKIDFTGDEWKTQLYEYTVDLVRSSDKFRDVSEYDLEDIIQDIYLYMLEYSIRRIESLGSVSFNRDMGNWSRYIRGAVDRYNVNNLYCKTICCSGYSYIDDSNLVNKDVIRSLEKRAHYRNDKDIYCVQEYFYKGRILDDIAEELGVTNSKVQERIRRDVWRLWIAARKIYDSDEWGEMRE